MPDSSPSRTLSTTRKMVGRPTRLRDCQPLDQAWVNEKIAANAADVRRWLVKRLAERAVQIVRKSEVVSEEKVK